MEFSRTIKISWLLNNITVDMIKNDVLMFFIESESLDFHIIHIDEKRNFLY